MRHLDKYYDDNGRQIKRLPEAWIVPQSRFKIGMKIIIRDLTRYGNQRKNVIAEIVKITPGYGSYAPACVLHDPQVPGWLTVKVPFCVGSVTHPSTRQLIPTYELAMGLDCEDIEWNLMTENHTGKGKRMFIAIGDRCWGKGKTMAAACNACLNNAPSRKRAEKQKFVYYETNDENACISDAGNIVYAKWAKMEPVEKK